MLRLMFVLLLMIGTVAQAQTKVPSSQAEISLGFAPLVKQAAPAVVNIYARRIVEGRRRPLMNDPFFEDFFRNFEQPRPRVQNSLGSGVILSADGIAVSNYHVVGMATEIRVILADRREYSARVVLGDKESDLAILQLEDARDLPYLDLRNSDQVEVGELVLAIGNPFGVGQTVSSGIVSGLARSGVATGQARGYFIQTDAPINPGNSGGALIDVNGDVIGINTSILSQSGGSNGIGFAIPANLVAEFVRQTRAGRTAFQRPWAGLMGQSVDADIASSLGLAAPDGVLISQVHPLSPFADAGFRVGDLITHVDMLEVNTPSEMLFRMTVAGVGQTALVRRLRQRVPGEVLVKMMAAPDTPPANEITLDQTTVLRGLRVASANPAMIARFGLPLGVTGAVVTEPGQFGARVGLRASDVINSVNGRDVATSRDVARALTNPGRRVSLDVVRQGKRIQLLFRL